MSRWHWPAERLVSCSRSLARTRWRNLDADIQLLNQVRVDGTVLAFTIVAAVVAGLVFGLTPAIRLSAVALNESLKEGGRSHSQGKRHGWTRGALVVSEVALACVLLVGSGLMLRSLFRVLDVDLGFQPRGVGHR